MTPFCPGLTCVPGLEAIEVWPMRSMAAALHRPRQRFWTACARTSSCGTSPTTTAPRAAYTGRCSARICQLVTCGLLVGVDPFMALADPIRRDLLRALASGPARVVDLASQHPISRPAVSKHLRLLTEAGLATVEDRGRERHYALAREGLDPVRDLVDELSGRRPRSLKARSTPSISKYAEPSVIGGAMATPCPTENDLRRNPHEQHSHRPPRDHRRPGQHRVRPHVPRRH
ncbi:ArsR/SmtB family transcription factor [Streptomyces zhihengii]